MPTINETESPMLHINTNHTRLKNNVSAFAPFPASVSIMAMRQQRTSTVWQSSKWIIGLARDWDLRLTNGFNHNLFQVSLFKTTYCSWFSSASMSQTSNKAGERTSFQVSSHVQVSRRCHPTSTFIVSCRWTPALRTQLHLSRRRKPLDKCLEFRETYKQNRLYFDVFWNPSFHTVCVCVCLCVTLCSEEASLSFLQSHIHTNLLYIFHFTVCVCAPSQHQWFDLTASKLVIESWLACTSHCGIHFVQALVHSCLLKKCGTCFAPSPKEVQKIQSNLVVKTRPNEKACILGRSRTRSEILHHKFSRVGCWAWSWTCGWCEKNPQNSHNCVCNGWTP